MKDQLQAVQILRALAALAVVAFHYAQSLADDFGFFAANPFPMGSDGVDVFFVISGFIMAYTTEPQDQRSAAQFAWKRLARILPLYWALTLTVFAIGLAAPQLLSAGAASLTELAKSLAFIPYERADGMVVPVLFLGWTLNYEMFFYAVFAAALLIAPNYRLQLAIGTIVVFALTGAAFGGQLGFLGRYYTNGLILEFAWGCLVFVAFRRWPQVLRTLSPLWMVGVALLVAQNFYDLPIPREFKKGLPAALIVAGILGATIKEGVLARAFARIGDASYSLYLGHPYAVEVCARIAIALLGVTVLGAVLTGVASFALAIGLAILSFYLLERPSNKWLRRLFPGRRRAPAAAA